MTRANNNTGPTPTAFDLRAEGDRLQLLIYDAIGPRADGTGIKASDVAEQLSGSPDSPVSVRINSTGGSVYHGLGIFNALQRHRGRVEVSIEGLALSAASLIAMAGDVIRMTANSLLMIHDPAGVAFGTAQNLRKTADDFERVRGVMANAYAERTGQSRDQIERWMAAETWFDASEAKAAGFCDEISAALKVAACGDLSVFQHPPADVQAKLSLSTKGHPMPANYTEIVAACEGCDPASKPEDAQFICDQLKAQASAADAARSWTTTLNARLESRRESTRGKRNGIQAPPEGASGSAAHGFTDPIAEFLEKVDSIVAERKCERYDAVREVNRRFPDLRQAYCDEFNRRHAR